MTSASNQRIAIVSEGIEISIRPCDTLDELHACVGLQKEVWQFPDIDVVPVRMFVVAQKIGGQVIGAFAGDRLAGFVLAIPGAHGTTSYLHSHMLAVLPEFRNLGLGRRLKLAQRDDALLRGFDLIEWTFDPLEIKNAYLNVQKLGAIARRYSIDHYGSSSSPLQGGLPTDRLIAEWWLHSKRVMAAVEGEGLPRINVQKSILVPAAIYEWKKSDAERGRAKSVQLENREALLSAFKAGLSVLGYERDPLGNGAFQLGHWDENLNFIEPIP